MRVTHEVGPYNTRRYGKPWIARVVDWPIGHSPQLVFGGSVGLHVAEIEAEAGELVRWGQKDHRGNGTVSKWGIVQPDGSIVRITEVEAREHYLATKAKPSTVQS